MAAAPSASIPMDVMDRRPASTQHRVLSPYATGTEAARLPAKTDLKVVQHLKQALAESSDILTDAQKDTVLAECHRAVAEQFAKLTTRDAALGDCSATARGIALAAGAAQQGGQQEVARMEGSLESYNVIDGVAQLLVRQARVAPGGNRTDIKLGKEERLHCYLFPREGGGG